MAGGVKDRLVMLWYRLTYCRRHGHYKVYEGQCLNCGASVAGRSR